MGAGTAVVVSVGADAMGAPGMTIAIVMVVRAVVRMTVARPAVTATSPPSDSWSNIVRGASCDAGGVWNAEGVSGGIWGGWIILAWLGKRVRATARGRGGRDVVCH